MKVVLREGERVDDLQIKGYQIIQNPKAFCFGMDAVLLSGFAKIKAGNVIDLGTGNGIIPLLLAAKTKASHIEGLEIQEANVEMAARSVALNELEDRVHITQGDIKEASKIFGQARFDAVTTNPPYMIHQHGLVNPDQAKAIARHEVLCNLEDVIRESARLLKPSGHFYMVHRPFRLTEILSLMRQYRIEPKSLRMVHSFIDKEPAMVLVEGIRGSKEGGLVVSAPLIIYKEQGVYSDEILRIYNMKE
jgi:tRNA1Val (adenine37-N6)-methyltransferase